MGHGRRWWQCSWCSPCCGGTALQRDWRAVLGTGCDPAELGMLQGAVGAARFSGCPLGCPLGHPLGHLLGHPLKHPLGHPSGCPLAHPPGHGAGPAHPPHPLPSPGRRDERPPEHLVLRPDQSTPGHAAGAQRHRVGTTHRPQSNPKLGSPRTGLGCSPAACPVSAPQVPDPLGPAGARGQRRAQPQEQLQQQAGPLQPRDTGRDPALSTPPGPGAKGKEEKGRKEGGKEGRRLLPRAGARRCPAWL